MRIQLRVLLVLLLGMVLICPPFARAAENPISGDFGLKLGEVFQPEPTAPGPAFEGFPLYPFHPEKASPAFKDYFVQMTPTSHRIFRIRAVGPAASPEECAKQQGQLMEALKEKLGSPKMDTVEAPDFTIKILTIGDRTVTVKCSSLGGGSLEIQYTDSKLKDLAETEKIRKGRK